MIKKLKLFFIKIIYLCYYAIFIICDRKKNQKEMNKVALKFLQLNNKIVLNSIKNRKINNIMILLPHCLQNYDCPIKVTSNVENCKICGKCVIGDFMGLKKKYQIDIKIATGGTLARKYIKEKKPELIIAVACKRDLISGIYDAFPAKVYGVFNDIVAEPCINTTVAVEKISFILENISSH